MASIPSFIFGAGTKYKTQEELEAAREQVKAMLGDIGQSGYTGWGGVMADLGKGIGARIGQGRIDEGQEQLLAEQSKLSEMFDFGGGGGGGGAGTDVLVGGGGSDTAAGGVGTDAGAGGGRVSEDAIRQGLIDRGLPPHVAEGFVMNMKDESGLRSGAVEGRPNVHGTRGFGLYQLTGPRRTAYEAFARARGVSPSDPDAQMDFLVQEGRTTEKGAFSRILQARTPGEAGASIVSNFLRPAKKHEIARRNKYLSADLSGGGGSDTQAGGGAGDSFLQAKPRRRMTPAMLEQEAGTEKRPIWDDNPLAGRRRMTPAMTGIPDAVPPAAPAAPAPSPLDGRRRMTPAMLNPAAAPVPAPMPAPDPARFGPTPPVPVAVPVPLQAPNPDRFAPAAFVPPAPQIFTPPASPRADRLGNPPPSMAGTETAPYPVPRPAVVPGQSMAGTETAQPMPAPRPAPPPPAPVPAPVPAPAIAKVDPFTDMILGDQAKNYRPGGYIPPAPVASAFPVAPPAPGTPAAAGFGVPQQAMAGGGGSNTVAGGGGQFPPAPAAPGAGGGGNKIAKLQFILASPYASKEQKLMAASMIEREYALEDERRKANTPGALLDFQYKQAQLAELQSKADMEDVVVVGKRLYNKKTKQFIDPPAGEPDGGPFDSTSVEGQALNGMVKNGTLTVQQAYDLATGKTVTDPKTGKIMFFTGTKLVGARPGETPQPIDPNAPVAQPGATPEPGVTVLTEGEPEKPPVNTRWIDENDHSQGVEPIPGSSAEQMPAELAARIGLAKDALKILPALEKTITAGGATGIGDWTMGSLGRGEQGALYREMAAASEALVRMLTGAGMNAEEARKETYLYLPQLQDDAPALTNKVQQLQRRLIATVEQAEKGRVSAKPSGRRTYNPATGELE